MRITWLRPVVRQAGRLGACGLVIAVIGAAAAPAAAADTVRHRKAFTFKDSQVAESSGLVDRRRLTATINDSGDRARVFVVDPSTGGTVGVTSYFSKWPIDVEAIAPGKSRSVWTGDIGDNSERRSSIAVYHVPNLRAGNRTVDAAKYTLSYPDGAHNAETLLVNPRNQRVFVVTKSAFGGTVFRAPRSLRSGALNHLGAFAQVSGVVTDGAFFPNGKHVLLRTYSAASVYSFPGFRLIRTVRLPKQRQGEGISVSARGRILISSEGVHSKVTRVWLPNKLAKRVTASASAPGAGASPPDSGAPASDHRWTGVAGDVGALMSAVALAAVGVLLLRRFRHGSPHAP